MKQKKEQKGIYKIKEVNGITLVALVITVIILLILAGVTISGLTGEKGLIKEAKTAKELTELAALEEQIELAIIKAEQKHRNPTLEDVIEEIKNNKVISKEDQVNKETGAVHTDAGYLIEGKLNDYIGKTSTGDGNTTGNNTTGGNNTEDGNTTGNNITGGGTTEETPTLPSTADTKPFLPTGATPVNGTSLDTGLVIRDSNDNEWVWIEVPKSIYTATTTSTDYTAIETAMQNYASDYRDSSHTDTFYSKEQHGFESAQAYNNWKNNMLESVFINGGFYIGRYEIGTISTSTRNSNSGISETPYIKQDLIPYNYIICSEAQTLAKQLSTGGRQASLMFGIQWDLIMKFIETKNIKTQKELKTDSSSWGNYYYSIFEVTRGKYLETKNNTWNTILSSYTTKADIGVILTTGAANRNSALNIYDLAGNIEEWTLERNNSDNSKACVFRGGSFSSFGGNAPASYHHNFYTTERNSSAGCRPALW